MIKHANTKIEIVDVETGEYLDSDIKKRRPSRSRSTEKQQKLLNYLLYGRENITHITSSFRYNEEALQLVIEFSRGTRNDVEYLSNCLIRARKDGINKEFVLAALVAMSMGEYDYNKESFKNTFKKVVYSLEDIEIILSIIKSKTLRGFGKILQKTIGAFINSLTIYDYISYIDTPSNGIRVFTLKDMIKFCHVKPANETQEAIFAHILRKVNTRKLPKIFLAYETLRQQSPTSEETKAVILNNNFPISIASRRGMLGDVESMGIHDIIKALSISQNDTADILLDRAILMFKSEKVISYSSLTPFHFLKLYDSIHFTDQLKERKLKRAIEKALELSYNNIEKIDGSLMILVDQNTQWATTNYFSTSISDSVTMAGFAAILSKISKDSYVIPISRKATPLKFLKDDSTLDIADQIISQSKGGDPNFSDAFQALSGMGKIDNIVGISCHSWYSILRNTRAGTVLSEYLNKLGTDYTTRLAFFSPQTESISAQNLRNSTFINGNDFYVIKFLLDFLSKKV